ncbi:MAG: hydrophobic protein [Acidimicrobiales bacterium]|nr:hydrophobic protein [Acidimicrobiales bacterium]
MVLAVIVALLFGASFLVEALLWVAIVAAAVWVVGFLVNGARRTVST